MICQFYFSLKACVDVKKNHLGVCCTDRGDVMKGKRTVRQDDFLPVRNQNICIYLCLLLFQVSDIDLGLLDDNDDYTHPYTNNKESISDIIFPQEEKKNKPTTTSIHMLFSVDIRKTVNFKE